MFTLALADPWRACSCRLGHAGFLPCKGRYFHYSCATSIWCAQTSLRGISWMCRKPSKRWTAQSFQIPPPQHMRPANHTKR